MLICVRRSKRQLTNSRCLTNPHQLSVDTIQTNNLSWKDYFHSDTFEVFTALFLLPQDDIDVTFDVDIVSGGGTAKVNLTWSNGKGYH